jgi:hypothetical protein
MGNDSVASAAGSHPRHRLFGQATPGPSSTLRPAAAAQGKKTTSTHRGKCYEPLDAKRHRYAWPPGVAAALTARTDLGILRGLGRMRTRPASDACACASISHSR